MAETLPRDCKVVVADGNADAFGDAVACFENRDKAGFEWYEVAEAEFCSDLHRNLLQRPHAVLGKLCASFKIL